MTTADTSPEASSPESLFANKDFRRYQTARFLLTIGIQMQSVAVGWHVYFITGSPLALGYVGLAQFLPQLAFSPITGHVADRFDRRTVVLVCYGAVLATALLMLATVNVHAMAPLYAILFLFGTTRAFVGPASSALLTNIVPIHLFARATAWGSTVWQVASIVGPSAGGVLYALAAGNAQNATRGASVVFASCAVLTIIAAISVFRMRVRTGRLEKKGMSLETLSAGLRYVLKNKMILGSISLDLFAVLLGGAVALLPIFAKDILHTQAWGLGLLRSAPAAGAALMALVFANRPIRRHAGAWMLFCVLVFGIATIVFALSKSFWISAVALFIVGASDMVSVVVRSVVVQIATPPEMRGRVSAVNFIFVGASNELGEFESGLTADLWGAKVAAAVGGIATCVVVALWALLFPSLRDVDDLESLADYGDKPAV
ncbi:MAG: MFS transporter [Polyangiaceae bacterium]